MLTASLAAASLAQARVGSADDSSPRCIGARRPDHRSRQPAHGFVDVYATSGAWVKRFATHGVLNSLWGITLAPVSFGQFSNDLLIGNFGDERIHAFDPKTGEVLGVLRGTSGVPLAIDGLWGLIVGDPGVGGVDSVWFSAGPEEESHGCSAPCVRVSPERGPSAQRPADGAFPGGCSAARCAEGPGGGDLEVSVGSGRGNGSAERLTPRLGPTQHLRQDRRPLDLPLPSD
jgi:hypothetical protein